MIRRDFLRSAVALGVLPSLGGHPWHTRVSTRAQSTTPPRLDARAHVNSTRIADWVEAKMGERVVTALDAGQLVDRLDAAEIPKALVLSTAYVMATDVWPKDESVEEEYAQVKIENDFAAEQADRYPDRLTPFLSLNPKRPYAVDEIDRCVDQLGMRGVKLHFWNSVVNVRDPAELGRVRQVFERAESKNIPVVVHVFNGELEDFGPDEVERFAQHVIERLPAVRVSFAHLGGAGGFAPVQAAILERLAALFPKERDDADRVFVDMAAVLFARKTERIRATPERGRQRMGELLQQWGLSRVLWGSDNIPDYLALSRDAWPLTAEEWSVVARQSGERFLTGT